MRKRRRLGSNCTHDATVTTVTAGIERIVCEECGYVRIGYDHRTCLSISKGPDSIEKGRQLLVGVLGSR